MTETIYADADDYATVAVENLQDGFDVDLEGDPYVTDPLDQKTVTDHHVRVTGVDIVTYSPVSVRIDFACIGSYVFPRGHLVAVYLPWSDDEE